MIGILVQTTYQHAITTRTLRGFNADMVIKASPKQHLINIKTLPSL